MYVSLSVVISDEYFSKQGKEIDWNDDIWVKKVDKIQEILSTEVSIYLLRRSTGFDDSLIDSMVQVRKKLINEYENYYEKYIEYNGFY